MLLSWNVLPTNFGNLEDIHYPADALNINKPLTVVGHSNIARGNAGCNWRHSESFWAHKTRGPLIIRGALASICEVCGRLIVFFKLYIWSLMIKKSDKNVYYWPVKNSVLWIHSECSVFSCRHLSRRLWEKTDLFDETEKSLPSDLTRCFLNTCRENGFLRSVGAFVRKLLHSVYNHAFTDIAIHSKYPIFKPVATFSG